MHRTNWYAAVALQLIIAILLFVFSIYLAVTAYPVVTFFQEREVTITYIGNVAVFVVLGTLALVGWLGLRTGKLWSWWLTLPRGCCHLLIASLRFAKFRIEGDLLSDCGDCSVSAVAVILLLVPSVRNSYFGRRSIQVADLL
jgi:hypothetical protein